MDEIVFEKCDKKYLRQAIRLSKKSTLKYKKNKVLKLGIARPIVKSELESLFVAKSGKTIVACILCHPVEDEDYEWFGCEGKNCYELGRACTNPKFRGKGLIGNLAKFVISQFPNSDFYFDTMFAPLKNEPCINAFEKIGFEKLKVKDWFSRTYQMQTSWLTMHYKNY